MSSRNTEWQRVAKAGTSSVFYDQTIFYDSIIEPTSGLDVFYDGTGTLTDWTNIDLI